MADAKKMTFGARKVYVIELEDGLQLRDNEGQDRYFIEWDRCDSPETILHWCCQLAGKNWVTPMHFRQFVLAATNRFGIDINW